MDQVFRNNLKQLRSQRPLTQQALADLVDVSRQTIISIEKGEYVPSTFLALRIAAALEIDINDIFYIERDEEKNMMKGK